MVTLYGEERVTKGGRDRNGQVSDPHAGEEEREEKKKEKKTAPVQ